MRVQIVWLLLLCVTCCHAKTVDYNLHYPFHYKTQTFTQTLTLKPNYQEHANQQHFYTTKIHYPLLNSSNKALTKNFNNQIKQRLDKVIKHFIKSLPKPSSLLKLKKSMKRPLTSGSNTLYVHYDAFYTDRFHVISVRFLVSYYHYGMAHPNSYFVTFNYDIRKQRTLRLNELFQSPDYLTTLQTITRDKLRRKIVANSGRQLDHFAKKILAEGTEAKIENYQDWNLTPHGLLLNFSPYQVAPYAVGPITILIPYTKLAVN